MPKTHGMTDGVFFDAPCGICGKPWALTYCPDCNEYLCAQHANGPCLEDDHDHDTAEKAEEDAR